MTIYGGFSGAYEYLAKGGKHGKRGKHGGTDGVFIGGDEPAQLADWADYPQSQNRRAKDLAVDEIISAMESLGLSTSGNTRAEKIAAIMAAIPNLKKDGKGFRGTAEKHEKICRKIGAVINNKFGDVVDLKAGAPAICQQVSEFVESLGAGIQLEFATVNRDLQRVLTNLVFLDNQMNDITKKIKEQIDVSKDAKLQRDTTNIIAVVDMIKQESKRQMEMLKNLLDVTVSPSDVELSMLLENKKNLPGVIERLDGNGLGTDSFSDVISRILLNTGLSAQMAEVVNNALKKVGVSLDEYAKASNMKDITEKIGEILREKKFESEELHEFLQAVELLYRNFYRSKDIAEMLKKNEALGGADRITAASISDISSRSYDGEKTSFEKQIEDRNVVRNAVLKNFNMVINDQFVEFVKTLTLLTDKLSAGNVPLSEQLDGFIKSLENFAPIILRKNTYLALSGYYSDALSKERKESFIANLRMVDSYVTSIIEMSLYGNLAEMFKSLHTTIEKLISIIDSYSDKIQEKFGRGEEGAAPDLDASGEYDAEYDGGASPFSSAPLTSVQGINWKLPAGIQESISMLKYYHNVAQVKRNMSYAGRDLENFSKNYEDMRGDSIAQQINAINKNCQITIEQVEKDGTLTDDEKKNLKKFLEVERDTKNNMYRTIEAIDEYMRIFTDALVKNQNDLMDIRRLLDGVEVIKDWYNKTSGKDLCNVFDIFESGNIKDEKKDDEPSSYYKTQSAKAKVMDGSQLVSLDKVYGNAEFGFIGRKYTKEFFKKFLILKNILNIFLQIGNSYGGQNLYKKIYLTPMKIYSNICDYLEMSAFQRSDGMYYPGKSYMTGNIVDSKLRNADIKIQMKSVNTKADYEYGFLDNMFVVVIKSMCAKVFTVAGLYDVFNRPYENPSISPLRMIVGGASVPKIESGATELYLRLPLLAEFYREIFAWNGDDKTFERSRPADDINIAEKISMLPEADGLFSAFIRLMFRKVQNSTNRNFSANDLAELINEINIIYNAMLAKGSKDTVVMDTIQAFVDDVNRRYGMVRRKDRDNYEKSFPSRNDYYQYLKDDAIVDLELQILPGEDTAEFEIDSNKRVPSRKYEKGLPVDPAANIDDRSKSVYGIKANHYKLWYAFRCMLDSKLKYKSPQFNKDPVTFRPSIKLAVKKLAQESSDEERFKIISRLVRGTGVYNKTDSLKYLMFHETVITGLNTLSAIHTVLSKFRQYVLERDLKLFTEKNIYNQVDFKKYYYDDTDTTAENVGKPVNFGKIFAKGEIVKNAKDSKAEFANKEKNLMNIIKTVYKVCADLGGLVSVQTDKVNVNNSERLALRLNFNALKECIMRLFKSVRYFMDALRPTINVEVMKHYVDKMQPGSLYWLQEQLLDKLLVGRDYPPVNDEKWRSPYISIDKLEEKINNTLALTDVNVALITPMFGKLINAKINPNTKAVDFRDNKNLYSLYALKLNNDNFIANPQYSTVSNGLFDKSKFKDASADKANGFVFKFNELLYHLIDKVFDRANEKIYAPFVSIANSVFNVPVMNQDVAYPDMTEGQIRINNNTINRTDLGTNPATLIRNEYANNRVNQSMIGYKLIDNVTSVTRGQIPPFNADDKKQILFTSLSLILKNLLMSKTTAQTPAYLLESISEVSPIVKESYRVNLPLFRNMFNELLSAAEFYKNVVNIVGDNLKAAHSEKLDQIVMASVEIIKSIDHVIREMGDVPKYGEVSADSIKTFVGLYGKHPLTPISSVNVILTNKTRIDNNALRVWPVYEVGSNEFKLLYSMRVMFGNYKHKLSAENLACPLDMVEAFNSTVDNKETVQVNEFMEFIDNIACIDKYLVSKTEFRGWIFSDFSRKYVYDVGKQNRDLKADIIVGNRTHRSINVIPASYDLIALNRNLVPSYPLLKSTTIADLLELITNNFRDEMISKFMDKYQPNAGVKTGSTDMTIQNIIDLNIVPINVHALMRDMPLINLYNYAYTFDRLMVNLYYGIDNEVSNNLISSLCNPVMNEFKADAIKTATKPNIPVYGPKELLVQSILNPYADITDADYGNLRAMLMGSTGTDLNRPRFLSDQLLLKVMFGSLEAFPSAPADGGNATLTTFNKETDQDALQDMNPTATKLKVSKVTMAMSYKDCVSVGVGRYNTVLVRNIVFMINAYRTMRMKLMQDLVYNKKPIATVLVDADFRRGQQLNSNLPDLSSFPQYTKI